MTTSKISSKHASKQRSIIFSRKKFYGTTDEQLFFKHVKQIPCIIKFDMTNKDVTLYFQQKALSKMDMYDVIYLCRRYKIDMRMLRQFLTKRNQKYIIMRTKAYWHKPLFGKQS